MKASETQFLKFLSKSTQLVIPIYQRTYSWTEAECEQFWTDVLRAGKDDNVSTHFIGSIVYIEEGLSQISAQSPQLVIDGQQRLTTITLLLEALARRIGEDEVVGGFTAMKIRHYYLTNQAESGEQYFKLILTQTDKTTLLSIVKQEELPATPSVRIKHNFKLFNKWVQELNDQQLKELCIGLQKLVIVDISLSREHDNPQLIFESMNSTGLELSHADLIRNYVLMGLKPHEQTTLYNRFWHPMEHLFGQDAYDRHFDGFIRHYLTLKTGEIPNIRDIYSAFKLHSRTKSVEGAGIAALLNDVHTFARYYAATHLGQESDRELAQAFNDLQELKVDVATPFLLALYDDYRLGTLEKADFLKILRRIESYVFRRATCGIATNTLNRTFAVFSRAINKENYLLSVEAQFLQLTGARRFPNDHEFQSDLVRKDIYNLRTKAYFFRRFENDGRKERVPVDDYTVEHILPQTPNLSSQWKNSLGSDWERVQETWLHTLGNLTLTGYNSEYSDRPFRDKREMAGGFKESPLRLNQGLRAIETWNEEAIILRGETLAHEALRIWAAPSRDGNPFFNTTSTANLSSYSIADHPDITPTGRHHQVFAELQRRILELDSSIYVEYLKVYVAFKSERNVVDVTVLKRGLTLTLNMPYGDIRDPRGLTRDVTHIGTNGNGDVEVRVDSMSDIPHVMPLIQQSLDFQLYVESILP